MTKKKKICHLKLVDDTQEKYLNHDDILRICKKNHWQPWLRVFNRNTLKNFTFPIGFVLEDLISLPFLYKNGMAIYELNESLIIYRINENSSSQLVSKKFYDSVEHAIKIYRKHKHDKSLQYVYYHAVDILYGILLKQSFKDYIKNTNKYRKDFIFISQNIKFSKMKKN